MKLPFFKKADILLLVILLLIGAASLAFALGGSGEGNTAVVTVDGDEAARIPLTEERWESTVETTYGTNVFLIENGSIRMEEADCPGGDCMRFAPISRSGQVIICLPHHMTVTVEGASDEDVPDAVIR